MFREIHQTKIVKTHNLMNLSFFDTPWKHVGILPIYMEHDNNVGIVAFRRVFKGCLRLP